MRVHCTAVRKDLACRLATEYGSGYGESNLRQQWSFAMAEGRVALAFENVLRSNISREEAERIKATFEKASGEAEIRPL